MSLLKAVSCDSREWLQKRVLETVSCLLSYVTKQTTNFVRVGFYWLWCFTLLQAHVCVYPKSVQLHTLPPPLPLPMCCWVSIHQTVSPKVLISLKLWIKMRSGIIYSHSKPSIVYRANIVCWTFCTTSLMNYAGIYAVDSTSWLLDSRQIIDETDVTIHRRWYCVWCDYCSSNFTGMLWDQSAYSSFKYNKIVSSPRRCVFLLRGVIFVLSYSAMACPMCNRASNYNIYKYYIHFLHFRQMHTSII